VGHVPVLQDVCQRIDEAALLMALISCSTLALMFIETDDSLKEESANQLTFCTAGGAHVPAPGGRIDGASDFGQ
jgi:hypothetical protein